MGLLPQVVGRRRGSRLGVNVRAAHRRGDSGSDRRGGIVRGAGAEGDVAVGSDHHDASAGDAEGVEPALSWQPLRGVWDIERETFDVGTFRVLGMGESDEGFAEVVED